MLIYLVIRLIYVINMSFLDFRIFIFSTKDIFPEKSWPEITLGDMMVCPDFRVKAHLTG